MGLKKHGKTGKSALSVSKGVERPPSVNPDYLTGLTGKRKRSYTPDEYVEKILSGNRTVLSQAITLIESSLPQHSDPAQAIIEKCLPYSKNSVRIGITGVPGVGKSSFIESLGKRVTSLGHRLAVLTVDPSSLQSGGSILGDKTRMESLAADPYAFIRTSPSAGTMGGVARKTRETIILCEAAGFDTIFVETVGVGQSEILVNSMVDFFLLLMLAGAGDELQGIKRGIMEMADAIAITKSDGSNIARADIARAEFENALQLFPPRSSGWKPKVLTCSAFESKGISEIWTLIEDYITLARANGHFAARRLDQAVDRMHENIAESLKNSFYSDQGVKKMMAVLEKKLREGEITSYTAAQKMLNKYFSKRSIKE